MRFTVGSPPLSDWNPDASWRALREPEPIVVQLIALPIGLLMALATAFVWLKFTPLSLQIDSQSLPAFIFATIFFVIPHELLHLFCHPQFGFSKASVLGVWPSRLLFFAHYLGELSRNWFLVILLTPLMVIVCFPCWRRSSFSTMQEYWPTFPSLMH